MKIQDLRTKLLKVNWDYFEPTEDIDINFDSPKEVCEHFKPHLNFKMSENTNNITNEATYKEIASMIDGNFLSQRVRASALQGIQLRSFDDNVANFYVNSSKFSTNRIQYLNRVLFEQWDEVGNDPEFNYPERARMLLWVGDLKLHCTCPSFLYWGYQWILTMIDASIEQEARRPVERNPQDRGVVCKHMNRVLRVLPFHLGDIATELKNQFGEE